MWLLLRQFVFELSLDLEDQATLHFDLLIETS